MGRVLIVDDEINICLALRDFLNNDGFDADTAEDAASASNMLESGGYDVVITDIMMPQLSGMELLSMIRRQSKAIQVIFMTGEPSLDTAVLAVQCGASDYITKPVSKDRLVKTVRQAMKVKRLSDQKNLLEKENQFYQKQLEELVAMRTQSLQNVMRGVISLLTSVVDARDPYTSGHQRRVGNLAAAIAFKMKLSFETVDMVRTIGYIHDIGKISIPAEILSKPGKLSELEFGIIRMHALKGYEMISKSNLPDIIGETIYQHHERYNGSGYPRGLTDDDMLPESKILIVADVVEAMVSHRPYRPALGLDVALDEIKRQSGVLYNPAVAEACLSLFRDDHYSIENNEHDIYIPI